MKLPFNNNNKKRTNEMDECVASEPFSIEISYMVEHD